MTLDGIHLKNTVNHQCQELFCSSTHEPLFIQEQEGWLNFPESAFHGWFVEILDQELLKGLFFPHQELHHFRISATWGSFHLRSLVYIFLDVEKAVQPLCRPLLTSSSSGNRWRRRWRKRRKFFQKFTSPMNYPLKWSKTLSCTPF